MSKFFAMFTVLVLSISSPAFAQDAPATLAEVAMPTNVLVDAFIRCMAATGKEKTCRTLAEREAKRSERTAKSASNALRAPNYVPPTYGYSSGYVSNGGYYSRGYDNTSYGYRAVTRPSGGRANAQRERQPSGGRQVAVTRPPASRRTPPPPAQ